MHHHMNFPRWLALYKNQNCIRKIEPGVVIVRYLQYLICYTQNYICY